MPEPSNTIPEDPPTPAQRPSVVRELFKRTSNYFWSLLGLDPLADDFHSHAGAVKKSKAIIFIAVIAVLSGVLGSCVNGFFANAEVDDLKSRLSSNEIAVGFLRDELTRSSRLVDEKNYEILKLKSEFQTLQTEIGPLRVIAASIFTNVPPNEQMARLIAQLQSVTNVLSLIDPSRLVFDVFVNRHAITNRSVIKLPAKDGVIKISVRNMGETTAENVTVGFTAKISPTNIVAPEWDKQLGRTAFKDGTISPVEGLLSWRFTSEQNIAARAYMNPPPIVLTNFTKPTVIGGGIEVFSDGSKKQEFLIKIEHE